MRIKYEQYKWFVWSILSFSFVIVFIHRLGLGVIADELARTLHLSGTELSNLAGMNLYAYAVMQIPAGVMVDYIGPRKTASLGMLFAGVGSILFSLAGSVWLAFLGRLITGLGVSVIFVSLMKIQAEWFEPREFSTMSGLTSFVGNIGSLLATTPLAMVVLWIGWRGSFMGLGVISLVFCVAIYAIVRNRPQEMGFSLSNRDLELNEEIPLWEGIKGVFKNKYTWPNIFLPGGFVAPVLTFLGVWGVSYLVQVHGLSKEAASGYMFAFALGIMTGGPVVGWLSDRLGKKRQLIFGAAVCYTIAWAVVIYCGEWLPLFLFPILFYMIGFLNIFHLLAFTNVKEVNHPRLAGIATSVINAGEFVLSALINLFTGIVLDAFWDGRMVDGVRYYSLGTYKIGFSVFIAMGLLAMVLSYIMKEKKDIERSEVKERAMGETA